MDFKLLKKPALLRRHQVKNNKIGTSWTLVEKEETHEYK